MQMFARFTIAVGYCFASNIEIPLSMDESEEYYADATTESASGQIVSRRFLVRFHPFSHPGSSDGMIHLGESATHIRVPIRRESRWLSDADMSAQIGIHPNSTFINNVGPVAVIRTESGSRLVLNASQEYWTDKCLDASILTFPVDQSDRMNLVLPRNVTFWLASSPSSTGEPLSWTGSIGTIALGLQVQTIALVPIALISRINRLLIRAGAIESSSTDSRRKEYTNCSRSMIESLPDFLIEWPTVGKLVFLGSEYIYQNSSSNTCISRLRPLNNLAQVTLISPLQYHQLNVRIARDSIQFCDPRF